METTLTITYNHETENYLAQNNDTQKLGIIMEFESITDVIDFIDASIQLDRVISRSVNEEEIVNEVTQ